jgi:hypothetical protein
MCLIRFFFGVLRQAGSFSDGMRVWVTHIKNS